MTSRHGIRTAAVDTVDYERWDKRIEVLGASAETTRIVKLAQNLFTIVGPEDISLGSETSLGVCGINSRHPP
ncbi:hypothetical protein MUK42_14400 [Musa troglodytarum]|uniref:Uncharacterized protein n=1 Tax=Musa troglodytarum TaxID=320322 RepID=A0A9E7HWT5_9LILI|nr:hypothetical protein MUK42_14400 [Musa troglodytarum]